MNLCAFLFHFYVFYFMRKTSNLIKRLKHSSQNSIIWEAILETDSVRHFESRFCSLRAIKTKWPSYRSGSSKIPSKTMGINYARRSHNLFLELRLPFLSKMSTIKSYRNIQKLKPFSYRFFFFFHSSGHLRHHTVNRSNIRQIWDIFLVKNWKRLVCI